MDDGGGLGEGRENWPRGVLALQCLQQGGKGPYVPIWQGIKTVLLLKY